ncbi:membrane hypothetical protein [Vibrio crassostreae]|nr:membrane hypothetical protein [Vibrio crassostreae]CAK2323505.1 membrane hypothetical protein [Vibrio crassostreae]CAK2450982.1 membrane hypothetical protein [Vibrio crassostreae]CAK2771854.1 membrane hypothetical protein [Vibrio crassostreae]
MNLISSALKSILDFVLISISPYVLIFRAFIEFLMGSNYLRISLALLLSSFFVYYSPEDITDIYRHYELFDEYQTAGDSLFLLNKYTGLGFLFISFDFLGIAKEGLPFLTGFIVVYVMLGAAEFKCEGVDRCWRPLIWVVFLLLPPFFFYVTGLRWGLAVVIFFHALLSEMKGRRWYKFYILLPLLFHFGMIIPIFTYFFSKYISTSHVKRNVRLTIVVTSILSSFLLVFIIQNAILLFNIEGIIGRSTESYLTGRFAIGYLDVLSGGVKAVFLSKMILLILLFSYIFVRNNSKGGLAAFSDYMIIITLMFAFSGLFVIYDRISVITIFTLLICQDFRGLNLFKIRLETFLLCIFVMYLGIMEKILYMRIYTDIYFGFDAFLDFYERLLF